MASFDSQREQARNRLALKEMLFITKEWGLSRAEQAMILQVHPSTLRRWIVAAEAGRALKLAHVQLIRMSHVLGINMSLKVLLPSSSNRRIWMHSAQVESQTPVRILTHGNLGQVERLRARLLGQEQC